jgi:uncharacterized membrane protein
MSLSFVFPLALWLLPAVLLLWLLAWLTRETNITRLGRLRYATLIALRSLILLGLILALAGTQLVRPVADTAVVFLVDGSDSVAPALREQALDYINAAVASADSEDRAAVVVFGADAAVERAPNPPAPLNRLNSVVLTSRTDIADAIQLGLALLPGDLQKRLVLLSDGSENEGRAAEAARLAALRGVTIDVVPLQGDAGPDVLVAAVEAPATAREGQQIPVLVRVESSLSGPARLELLSDGVLVAEQEVTLSLGRNEYVVDLPAGEAGVRRFEARITAAGDTQALNNRGAGFTLVQGPPRVLLIASTPDRAAPLQNALAAAGIRVELREPAQVPSDPLELGLYAAVFLVDLRAAEVSTALQRALVSYVRDQGGGLAMIGGSDAYGAGGWRRTPIAEILPIELDPPPREERPDLALALVIDRSGSMGEFAGGNRTKLALAKEAVYQATLGLARNDRLAVIAFDEFATEILPIQPLPDLLTVEDALSRMNEGGGTNIRSGIELAATTLAETDARIKHVILLTDGLADSNYADLIEQMRSANVTISIVSIGNDANPNLSNIATIGGGAFYRVLAAPDVPQIFLEETVRVADRDIVEGAFNPIVTLEAPPIRGLGPLPPLYGYNAGEARETARTLIVAPDGAPVLAIGQNGLGRVLAWTSDLKGQWAADWLAWEQFGVFAAGLADVLRPPPAADRLALEMRSEGSQAIIDLVVTDGAIANLTAEQISGRLRDPSGAGIDLRFERVSLGRYRAVLNIDDPGVYLAQVVAVDADGATIGSVSDGLVVSYSPEYGRSAASETLLEDLAGIGTGQVGPTPDAVFAATGRTVGRVREISLPLLWLALVLLPFDIALRRLFLRWATIREMFARRSRSPAPVPVESPAVARLRNVREQVRHERAQRTPRRAAPPVQAAKPPQAESQPPSEPSTAPVPKPPADPPAQSDTEDRLATLLAAKNRRRRQ